MLWRFARPHTVIGTALSVVGIFAIAADATTVEDPVLQLAATLVAALSVNVFIVGVNQVQDIEIDRVNKPQLPLAAGDLTLAQGRAIVAVSGVLPVVMALTQGWAETIAVGTALAIGWAYSCPPLHLKRYPVAASASITVVRSLVVNLGVVLHFTGGAVPDAVWALTLFVVPFAFAIAVFKDVPDAAGDSQFHIRTFTVRLGARAAFAMGMAALTVAYLGMALLGPFGIGGAAAHVAVLALLWWWAARADLDAFTPFYMRVWGLFFLEYLIVPAAVLSGA